MNLTAHFTLEEFVVSQEAARRGIDNTPPDEVVDRLGVVAEALEVAREILENPIVVSSGYRCPSLNALVGGADRSDHLLGYAADFICPGHGSAYEVAKRLAGVPRFMALVDQLIYEWTWVHVSVNPRLRGELLTRQAGGKWARGIIHEVATLG
ncbi:MAG: D-Ala-D-Ala carboxypeptidase family metallohydrolase [Egibacteraceae bacterium]